LYGKAWITLQPHFYATDSLTLDAKGMDIHKVEMVSGKTNKALKYKYDGWILNIKLDKS
jgi:aminopeptidase N